MLAELRRSNSLGIANFRGGSYGGVLLYFSLEVKLFAKGMLWRFYSFHSAFHFTEKKLVSLLRRRYFFYTVTYSCKVLLSPVLCIFLRENWFMQMSR
jgi:hypothetical protein